MLLLAQLIAPPLQPGPVRLPERAPVERPTSQEAPSKLELEGIQTSPSNGERKTPETESDTLPPAQVPELPRIQGSSPYKPEQLESILKACVVSSRDETLTACAAALTTRLVNDGYINTRVYISQPYSLEVIEGRIAELKITGGHDRAVRRVRKRLAFLKGSVLNLQSLEKALLEARRIPGVGLIKGSLGRLGSDPSQAVLNLNVDASYEPWNGEISSRNDGSAGSGEWRMLGVISKSSMALDGDTLLLFGEINADSDSEFGSVISSFSYTWPLLERLKLSTSFGYSRRHLIEAEGAAHEITFRQFQGFGQLEWSLKDTANDQLYAFAGFSANRNDGYLYDRAFPLVVGGGLDGWLKTGYFRTGVGFAGRRGSLSWSGNIYGLQGISGVSTAQQLEELAVVGVIPGQARAIGGLLNIDWAIVPRLQLNLRGAGQYAFSELTSDMGFSLGSDVGLRGLPGSYISGNNGYLWTSELNITLWSKRMQALQLVPFLGAGGISSTYRSVTFSDTVGSGGVLARWIGGKHWIVELGWVNPFDTNERAYWNQWILSKGVYGKVQYRF